MTDPRPRPRPQGTIPPSQRRQQPPADPHATGPIPIGLPTVQARTDEPTPEPVTPGPFEPATPDVVATPTPELGPDVEWPRCWSCGWSLLSDLVGDLWCPHWACEQYRRVVGTLVADRETSERLRSALAAADGEQHSDQRRQEPPSH